jgi:thiol:disulfide interchange protein DsbD
MRAISRGSKTKRPRAERLAGVALAFVVPAFATALAAGLPSQPKLLPPDQAFRLSARALDTTTIEARFDVAEGYYLYRDRIHFSVGSSGNLPAALPGGLRKHDEFFGDVETYRGPVVIRVSLPSAMLPGRTVVLNTDSQGCADAGVCYPPNPQRVEMPVPAAGTKPGDFVEAMGKKSWLK